MTKVSKKNGNITAPKDFQQISFDIRIYFTIIHYIVGINAT